MIWKKYPKEHDCCLHFLWSDWCCQNTVHGLYSWNQFHEIFVKLISRNFREIHFTKKLHRLLFGSKYFSWEIDDWRGFFCFAILSKLMRWERNDKCAILISLWKSVFIKQSPRISPPLCGLPVNAPFFMPPSLSHPLFSHNELKWGKKFYPLNFLLHWNKFPLILTIEENSDLCIVLSK